MSRCLFFLLSLALVASLVFPALMGSSDADSRSRGVGFSVVDWKISWEEGEKNLLLRIKGRTRGTNNDLGEDFEMETRNTAAIIDVLRTCGMGRLMGTATVGSDSGGKVTGEALTSLSCRAILK